MKYFYDCEFLEGKQTKTFCGIKYGETPPTIDLISIGIVAEDNREYYAISKDFNLKEAWNRFDLKKEWYHLGDNNRTQKDVKVFWIRENVLYPIFYELAQRQFHDINFKDEWHFEQAPVTFDTFKRVFANDFKWFKKLILKYGKTNKQIADEIVDFVNSETVKQTGTSQTASQLTKESIDNLRRGYLTTAFYGYYSAYDHVAMCWVFGKMIDLPKGFPMYTIDLKQSLDNLLSEDSNGLVLRNGKTAINVVELRNLKTLDERIEWCKSYAKYPHFPKQENEHSAIHDARWNKKLYEFLQKI